MRCGRILRGRAGASWYSCGRSSCSTSSTCRKVHRETRPSQPPHFRRLHLCLSHFRSPHLRNLHLCRPHLRRPHHRRSHTRRSRSAGGDHERIDELVLEYSALFDKVPEYSGLKRPKHHFLSHLALDAWRYGPPRGYWCFGFEHFNAVLKDGARRCQWKNEVVSVMRYWSLRSARKMCASRM